MEDFRLEIRKMAEETRDLITQERQLSLRIVMNIAVLDKNNAECNMGPLRGRIWDFLDLTENQYWKRCQMARTITKFPVLGEWVASGEVSLTHVAMVAGKITDANSDVILDSLRDKSTRELAMFLSRVDATGELIPADEIFEVTLRLTKEQVQLLDRCREVLASGGNVPSMETIIEESMNDLLSKRDKLEKAKRAMARATKKPTCSGPEKVISFDTKIKSEGNFGSIKPAARQEFRKESETSRRLGTKALREHELCLRSGGQCMHVYEDGVRCEARMMLEIDHIHMRCRGGGNEGRNLRIVCRKHNQQYAEDQLGTAFIDVKRLKKLKSLLSTLDNNDSLSPRHGFRTYAPAGENLRCIFDVGLCVGAFRFIGNSLRTLA